MGNPSQLQQRFKVLDSYIFALKQGSVTEKSHSQEFVWEDGSLEDEHGHLQSDYHENPQSYPRQRVLKRARNTPGVRVVETESGFVVTLR